MLLLIDHISFATADLEADLETFRAWGYEVEFRESGLADLENKRGYMQHFSGDLEMCLMKHPSGLSVELINHGHSNAEPSNVAPLGEQAGTEQIEIATADMAASIAFWQLLGFKLLSEDENTAALKFKAMMGGADCELLLRHTAAMPPPTLLDSHGFNCLALFSSDAVKDRAKLAGKWHEVSELNELHVGGKDLSIFWLRGPAGEMVEVIGLKK